MCVHVYVYVYVCVCVVCLCVRVCMCVFVEAGRRRAVSAPRQGGCATGQKEAWHTESWHLGYREKVVLFLRMCSYVCLQSSRRQKRTVQAIPEEKAKEIHKQEQGALLLLLRSPHSSSASCFLGLVDGSSQSASKISRYSLSFVFFSPLLVCRPFLFSPFLGG
jgi:hypothetical protein